MDSYILEKNSSSPLMIAERQLESWRNQQEKQEGNLLTANIMSNDCSRLSKTRPASQHFG